MQAALSLGHYPPLHQRAKASYTSKVRALTVIGLLLLFPLFTNSQGTKISTAADRDSVERLCALPASFGGQMTCAHCPGYELNLFRTGPTFFE